MFCCKNSWTIIAVPGWHPCAAQHVFPIPLQIMHAGQCCVAVDAAAVILPKGNGPSCAKQLQDMKIMG